MSIMFRRFLMFNVDYYVTQFLPSKRPEFFTDQFLLYIFSSVHGRF